MKISVTHALMKLRQTPIDGGLPSPVEILHKRTVSKHVSAPARHSWADNCRRRLILEKEGHKLPWTTCRLRVLYLMINSDLLPVKEIHITPEQAHWRSNFPIGCNIWAQQEATGGLKLHSQFKTTSHFKTNIPSRITHFNIYVPSGTTYARLSSNPGPISITRPPAPCITAPINNASLMKIWLRKRE